LELNASRLSEATSGGIYAIPDYRVDWNISVGAFADIPIRFTYLFLHPGIHFKQIGISEAFSNGGKEYDLIVNMSSISFPLLFRYVLLADRFSPYVQLGPVYSRALRNESFLYEYEPTGSDIYIDIVHSHVMQNDQAGFSIGGGLIYERDSKSDWFGEIRYNKYYNLSPESNFLNLGEITFGLGLIF
jgi:hypothetical protein